MAVLVNKKTAGGGEIVAAALQDWKRATVVGAATYGSSATLRWIPLSDGSGVELTITDWFTPKGRSLRGSGIVPDITVDPSNAATTGTAGDAPLQEALRLLKAAVEASPR